MCDSLYRLAIESEGLDPKGVARTVASVFGDMIHYHGFGKLHLLYYNTNSYICLHNVIKLHVIHYHGFGKLHLLYYTTSYILLHCMFKLHVIHYHGFGKLHLLYYN